MGCNALFPLESYKDGLYRVTNPRKLSAYWPKSEASQTYSTRANSKSKLTGHRILAEICRILGWLVDLYEGKTVKVHEC